MLKNGEIRVLRDSLKGAQQEKEAQTQTQMLLEIQRQKEQNDKEKELKKKVRSRKHNHKASVVLCLQWWCVLRSGSVFTNRAAVQRSRDQRNEIQTAQLRKKEDCFSAVLAQVSDQDLKCEWSPPAHFYSEKQMLRLHKINKYIGDCYYPQCFCQWKYWNNSNFLWRL